MKRRSCACFFAVEEPSDDDGAINAYQDKSYIDVEKHPDQFRYPKAGKFVRKHITPRITTQGGLLTIHPKPCEPFEAREMDKIITPNRRAALRQTLNIYGLDRFSLFPALDGLAAHIEWLQARHESAGSDAHRLYLQ